MTPGRRPWCGVSSTTLVAAIVITFVTIACTNTNRPSAQPAANATPVSDSSDEIPRFKVDPFWARDLPNDWILGQVSGVAVDAQDHVWIVHRPRTLDARQRGEEGMCCVPAPPVIEFAPDGALEIQTPECLKGERLGSTVGTEWPKVPLRTSVLGPYSVTAKIGKGGMGEAYEPEQAGYRDPGSCNP